MSEKVQLHIRKEVLLNIVINFFINAGLAWMILGNKGPLQLWGMEGFGTDLMMTGFMLSAILFALMVTLNRRKLRRGALPPVALPANHWLLAMPDQLWKTALIVGLAGVVLAALPLIIALIATGYSVLDPAYYALIKGVWAGLWAGVVVAVAIKQALRKPVVA